MDNVVWSRLADQQLLEVVEVDLSATVDEAAELAHGRWVAIRRPDGKALSAVDPATLADRPPGRTIGSVLADLPPVVVAAAETPVGHLLKSWLTAELEPGSAFVAVSGGRVAGVWAGPEMRQAIAFASDRGLWDPGLPGDVQIPLLTRRCRFLAAGTACTAVCQFAERPDPPPPCPNPVPLVAHPFEW